MLPKWKGYRIRAEVVRTEDDVVASHRLVKIPVDQVDAWDAEHDDVGEVRLRHAISRQEIKN